MYKPSVKPNDSLKKLWEQLKDKLMFDNPSARKPNMSASTVQQPIVRETAFQSAHEI